MINAEQIRASRALLDWTTAEVAKKSGLTVNGINKIERGHVNAQRDSLEKIQSVFENAGIEFLPESGVRRKDGMVTTHEGKDYLKNLMSDFYDTLHRTGGEVLAAHENESSSAEDIGKAFLQEQLKKRNKAGIKHRFLVHADDKAPRPLYGSCRVVPEPYFSNYPLWIYGSKLALSLRKYAQKSIVIDNERIADSARKLFEFIWDHTEELPQERKQAPHKKAKSNAARHHD